MLNDDGQKQRDLFCLGICESMRSPFCDGVLQHTKRHPRIVPRLVLDQDPNENRTAFFSRHPEQSIRKQFSEFFIEERGVVERQPIEGQALRQLGGQHTIDFLGRNLLVPKGVFKKAVVGI